MTKYIDVLEEEVDSAIMKKEKARKDWLADVGDPVKFQALHRAYLEYKEVTAKWLSANVAKRKPPLSV